MALITATLLLLLLLLGNLLGNLSTAMLLPTAQSSLLLSLPPHLISPLLPPARPFVTAHIVLLLTAVPAADPVSWVPITLSFACKTKVILQNKLHTLNPNEEFSVSSNAAGRVHIAVILDLDAGHQSDNHLLFTLPGQSPRSFLMYPDSDLLTSLSTLSPQTLLGASSSRVSITAQSAEKVASIVRIISRAALNWNVCISHRSSRLHSRGHARSVCLTPITTANNVPIYDVSAQGASHLERLIRPTTAFPNTTSQTLHKRALGLTFHDISRLVGSWIFPAPSVDRKITQITVYIHRTRTFFSATLTSAKNTLSTFVLSTASQILQFIHTLLRALSIPFSLVAQSLSSTLKWPEILLTQRFIESYFLGLIPLMDRLIHEKQDSYLNFWKNASTQWDDKIQSKIVGFVGSEKETVGDLGIVDEDDGADDLDSASWNIPARSPDVTQDGSSSSFVNEKPDPATVGDDDDWEFWDKRKWNNNLKLSDRMSAAPQFSDDRRSSPFSAAQGPVPQRMPSGKVSSTDLPIATGPKRPASTIEFDSVLTHMDSEESLRLSSSSLPSSRLLSPHPVKIHIPTRQELQEPPQDIQVKIVHDLVWESLTLAARQTDKTTGDLFDPSDLSKLSVELDTHRARLKHLVDRLPTNTSRKQASLLKRVLKTLTQFSRDISVIPITALLSLAKSIIPLIARNLQLIFCDSLSLFGPLLKFFHTTLTLRIRIPILSSIFRSMTNTDLTILRIISLLGGVAALYQFRLWFRKPPFGEVDVDVLTSAGNAVEMFHVWMTDPRTEITDRLDTTTAEFRFGTIDWIIQIHTLVRLFPLFFRFISLTIPLDALLCQFRDASPSRPHRKRRQPRFWRLLGIHVFRDLLSHRPTPNRTSRA